MTGRQVAQAMKVFIVSQAGKVADVTLQSSCYAEDESVIKVNVYVIVVHIFKICPSKTMHIAYKNKMKHKV